MLVREFQIVDLGVFPKESDVSLFGPGFRDLPDVAIADGGSAKEAFVNLLNSLVTDGLGIADVQRAGRAQHLESPDAETLVADLVDPDDEDLAGAEVAYFVGIRFVDPRAPIDVEEVDEDEDEDEDEEGEEEP